jgi:hypothetical protein
VFPKARRLAHAEKMKKLSPTCSSKRSDARREMKDREIIADNLKKAGWCCGRVSVLDSQGANDPDC